MRDLHSDIKVVQSIACAEYDDDNTAVAVDRQGYESVEYVLAVGVGGIEFDASNKIEFKLTHSDDNTNYEAVSAADVLGVESVGNDGIVKALTAQHEAAAVYRFGYIGNKRYTKLLADFSGSHGTGTVLAAVAILSHAQMKPVANQI